MLEKLADLGFLGQAFGRVEKNHGGPGGDGVTIAAFRQDLSDNLQRLARELADRLYRPGPLRFADIPKKSGGSRRLSIPCVRDRVAQTALADLLHPLAEEEFEDSSFGYRRGRGVKQAVRLIERFRDEGFQHVLDADIENYFDSVPHDRLLDCLDRLTGDDRDIRDLVALWLYHGDPESDGRGLAQGSPLSPLLANLYLDDLDERFSGNGLRIVRFADDFIVLSKSLKKAEDALAEVEQHLKEAGLQLHPEKTRIASFEEGFRFLGHLFVRSMALKSTEREIGIGSQLAVAGRPGEGELSGRGEDDHPEVNQETSVPGDSMDVLPLEAAEGDWLDEMPGGSGEHRASALRALYLRTPGLTLGLRNQAFCVRQDEKETFSVHPNWVDRIEIGPLSHVSDSALRQAIAYQIPVVFTSGGDRPIGSVQPVSAGYGKRQLAQAAAILCPHRSLDLARSFADGRIANQKALLYRLNRRQKLSETAVAARKIGRIARKLKIADTTDEVRGVEGEAASLYWPALGALILHGFTLTKRGRREGNNPVSVVLDFLSHLLTRDMETLVLRSGLHPSFGLLHASRDIEAFPAAYDLVEAFRAPLAEGLAIYLFNNRILTDADFGTTTSGAVRLRPDASNKIIRNYEKWAGRLLQDPSDGRQKSWKALMASDVKRFCKCLEESVPFEPYKMDY